MHYYKINQQCATKCNGEYFDALSWLIASKYKKDNKLANQYAQNAFAISDDPVEFLKKLESDIKADTQQVVAIKGKQ